MLGIKVELLSIENQMKKANMLLECKKLLYLIFRQGINRIEILNRASKLKERISQNDEIRMSNLEDRIQRNRDGK